MQEIVSAMDVRHKLRDILNRVDLLQGQFIIERKGRALAAIVPLKLLQEIQNGMRKKRHTAK